MPNRLDRSEQKSIQHQLENSINRLDFKHSSKTWMGKKVESIGRRFDLIIQKISYSLTHKFSWSSLPEREFRSLQKLVTKLNSELSSIDDPEKIDFLSKDILKNMETIKAIFQKLQNKTDGVPVKYLERLGKLIDDLEDLAMFTPPNEAPPELPVKPDIKSLREEEDIKIFNTSLSGTFERLQTVDREIKGVENNQPKLNQSLKEKVRILKEQTNLLIMEGNRLQQTISELENQLMEAEENISDVKDLKSAEGRQKLAEIKLLSEELDAQQLRYQQIVKKVESNRKEMNEIQEQIE